MEETTRASATEKPRPFERTAQIILAEAIAVMLLLLAVILIKFCFADLYMDLQNWYTRHLCAETELAEVLDTAGVGVDEV